MSILKGIYDIFIKPKTVEPRFWGNVALFPVKVIGERLARLSQEAEDKRIIAAARRDYDRLAPERQRLALEEQEKAAAEKDRAILENRLSEPEQKGLEWRRRNPIRVLVTAKDWRLMLIEPVRLDVLLRTQGRQAAIDAHVKESEFVFQLNPRPFNRSGAAASLREYRGNFEASMKELRAAHGPARVEALFGVDVEVVLRTLDRLSLKKGHVRSFALVQKTLNTFWNYDKPARQDGEQLFNLTVSEVAYITVWRSVMERELGVPLRPLGTADEIGIDPARHAEIVMALEHYEPTVAPWHGSSVEYEGRTI